MCRSSQAVLVFGLNKALRVASVSLGSTGGRPAHINFGNLNKIEGLLISEEDHRRGSCGTAERVGTAGRRSVRCSLGRTQKTKIAGRLLR